MTKINKLPVAIGLFAVLVAASPAGAQLAFANALSSNFNPQYTSSNPNTYMGDAYTLAPGTTQITGFDLFPLNATVNNYVGLEVNVWVWGAVNTSGTVNAANPAFSDLLGSYTATASGTFSSGYYFPFEDVPGTSPGFTLPAPLSIPSTTIGLTFSYEGTLDGTTYATARNLTSIITSNAPTAGSTALNGYYRGSSTTGNFTSAINTISGGTYNVAVDIYTASPVPEPSALTLACLGAAGLFGLRRRKA